MRTVDICRVNRLFRICCSHTKWKSEFKSSLVYRWLSSTTDCFRQFIRRHIDCQINDRRPTCVFLHRTGDILRADACIPVTIGNDKRILQFQTDCLTLHKYGYKNKIMYLTTRSALSRALIVLKPIAVRNWFAAAAVPTTHTKSREGDRKTRLIAAAADNRQLQAQYRLVYTREGEQSNVDVILNKNWTIFFHHRGFLLLNMVWDSTECSGLNQLQQQQ